MQLVLSLVVAADAAARSQEPSELPGLTAPVENLAEYLRIRQAIHLAAAGGPSAEPVPAGRARSGDASFE